MKKTMQTFLQLPVVLVCLFLCSSVSLTARDKVEKERVEEFSYPVDAGATISLDNRFGSIVVSHHDKQEVKVKVTIHVEFNSSQNADKAAQERLDEIEIKRRGSRSSISIVSDVPDFQSRRFSFVKQQRVNIQYQVIMPADMKGDIAMKYGTITMPEENKGPFKLIVKYGDIKGGNFSENLVVDAKYSDVFLGNVENLKANAAYSDFHVNSGNHILVESRYSVWKFGETTDIIADLSYDDLEVGSTKELRVNGRYSDVVLNQLKNHGDLEVTDFDYCDLKVENVAADFKRIELEGRYADCILNIDRDCRFVVLEDQSRYGDIRLSSDFEPVTFKKGSNQHHLINLTEHGAIKVSDMEGKRDGVIKVTDFGYSDIRIREK